MNLSGLHKDHEGLNLIEFIMERQKITSMSDLPALQSFLRVAGDTTGAEFIGNWEQNLKFHIEREWVVDNEK